MRYRLAVFDFDGTLADSFPWFLEVVNRLADRHRFRRIEPHEVDSLRGRDARRIVGHLGIPTWRLPWIARDMRRLMADDLHRISLFPGAGEALRRLDGAGVGLAVVTSNSRENVRRVLGPANAALVRHFECGVGLFGKRSKLRRVVRAAGVLPSETLCIGDEIRDLRAARAEALPFGAVAWGYTRLDALVARSPEEVFTSFDAMAERLAGG